jgi:hypothetical protein
MAFDPSTAQVLPTQQKFDVNSAQPVDTNNISVFNPSNSTIVDTDIDDAIKVSYMSDTQINSIPREQYFGMQNIEEDNKYIQDFIGQESGVFLDIARSVSNLIVETGQDIKRFGTKIGAKAIIASQLQIKGLKGQEFEEEMSEWNKMISVELGEIAKQNHKYRQELGIAKTEYDGIAYDLSSVFGQLGMAVLTKNPALIAGIFGVQQQQKISEEIFATTGEAGRAEVVATGVAIPTAMLEFVGLNKFFKALQGNKLVSKIAQGFVIEAVQEGSQGLVEEVGTQVFGGRQKSLEQTGKDIVYQMILGGVAGSSVAGMIGIGESALKKQGISDKNAKELSTSIVNKIENSPEIHRETANIINRESDNTTHYGNNIDNGIAEAKKAIGEETKVERIVDPVQNIIEEARGENINLGEQELLDILDTFEDAQKEFAKIKPKTLIQFIKESGGIFDEQGDIATRDLAKQYPFVLAKSPKIEIQTAQGKIQKDISPDSVALDAFQNTYFDKRPTVNELLDAIDSELRGKKIIRRDEVDDVVRKQELSDTISRIDEAVDIDEIRTLRDFRAGKVRLPGQLTEEEALQQISEEQERQFREQQTVARERAIERELIKAEQNFDKKIIRTKDKKELGIIEDTLKPISTVLKDVDPRLAQELRSSDMNAKVRRQQYFKQVQPFLKVASKIKGADAAKLDLALKNRATKQINELGKKYGFDYAPVRKVLDEVYDEATKTGSTFGYRKDYYPAKVKDYSGFMNYVYGRQDWGEIQAYLKEEGLLEQSPQKQAEAINLYLLGQILRKKDTTKRGFQKEKRVDIITDELNDFYDNSLSALVSYLGNINNTITLNKFFKGDPKTIENGVGTLLAGLTNNRQLTPGEQARVRQALIDYFGSPRTGKKIQIYKNVAYLTGLTNVGSTITQFKDLYISLYKNGVFHTAKAIVQPNQIKAADLGIDRAMEEIEDIQGTIFKTDTSLEKANKRIDNLLKTSLKLSLFDKMDKFGKNTFVQSSLNKYTSLSKKSPTKLRNEISEAFGDKADKIVEDLKNDFISPEVKEFLFHKIADAMPISRTEMPSVYLRSPGARLFYTFKTYTIKQLDIMNQDVLQQIKKGTPKDITEGFKNLTMITFFYSLVGIPVDMMKDFIFDRSEDKEIIDDYVFDNILQVGGISKWNIYNFKRNGVDIGLIQTVAPPIPIVVDLTRDIVGEEDFEDWRTVKNIPVGGKMYYWWFGGGSEF